MIELLLRIKNSLQNFILSMETFFKILFLSKFSAPIKKVKKDNNKLLILANGPSLKGFLSSEIDFSAYDLLTVNFFPFTAYFKTLQPKYLLITAPELWRKNVKQEYLDLSEQFFNTLMTDVSWPLYLFIPFESRKFHNWQTKINSNNKIRIVHFNNTPVEGSKYLNHLFFAKNLGMPRPHNVLIPSLMMAISMKYNQILLAGVDHSWLGEISVTKDNEALVCQKHFYDEDTATNQPMNQAGIRTRKLHEILHKFYLTFKAYFEIEEYAVSKGVKIINCTPNSFIDAFEKKTLI